MLSFELNDYPAHNIGGVLLKHYDEILKVADKYNCITLYVCNGIWHGSYRIPHAAGFSTPTSVCKDGTLSVCHGIGSLSIRHILQRLLEWKKMYEGQVVRRDNISTFTEDNITCHICSEDYAKGESIITLECNHQFHSQCMHKWRTHGLSAKDVFIQIHVEEKRLIAACPVCSKNTS